MVDVPYVVVQLFLPADVVPSVTLRPAADAGAHLVAAAVVGTIQGEVLGKEGPRPYQRHVALEDVDELGQLVDARAAHEATHGCQPLRVGQQPALAVALVGHGLELIDAEDAAVLARSLLREEDTGSLVGEAEPHRHHEQQGRDDNQCRQCHPKVQEPLNIMSVHCPLISFP